MGYPRILVVDDEENFLSLVTKVLGKEGYEVRTAADGNQAWAWLEKESFDLALIDVRMAPIGGLSLLNRIKESYPRIRVIMITAYPTPETRDLASLKGAVAYLVKPIDIYELKDAVRGHLLPK